MARPARIDMEAFARWHHDHAEWARVERDGVEALEKRFTFPDFATALAFVVRLGMAAEKRDHHPDIAMGWGKATVLWTTHDAGGITELDLALAEESDRIRST